MLNEEQIRERLAILLKQECDQPSELYWMSFCDPDKPKGQQFLGVVVVEATGFMSAQQKALELGVNPGGEIKAFRVKGVPKEFHDRLLSRAELEASGLA